MNTSRCMVWLLLMACSISCMAQTREPRVDLDSLVAVELATVAADPVFGMPVVLLRDPERGELVVISIGVAEARAILMALQAVPVPRPMTHDLLANLLQALDAKLLRVLVDDLSDNTFFGLLELEVPGRNQPLYVDSRPSDALALAARTGAPIMVAPEVLEAGRDREFEALQDGTTVTALGVTVVDATEALRGALELPEQPGVLVTRALGTAGEEGLGAGMLILAINGESVRDPMHFLELASAIKADEKALLRYWHEGSEHEIEVPGDLPASRGTRARRLDI